MTDTSNNDAIHGDEHLIDEVEPSITAHLAAKQALLDKLKAGDEDLRAIAIDALIQNDSFWESVFNIGAANCSDASYLWEQGINIGVGVFASIAGEVHDLSVEVEESCS